MKIKTVAVVAGCVSFAGYLGIWAGEGQYQASQVASIPAAWRKPLGIIGGIWFGICFPVSAPTLHYVWKQRVQRVREQLHELEEQQKMLSEEVLKRAADAVKNAEEWNEQMGWDEVNSRALEIS